ncbi:MAG: hypothetical protein KBG77_14805 [Dermatophilaceae bacterium]|nr:hypothetical protein [Dermatophilaceae bacterium]
MAVSLPRAMTPPDSPSVVRPATVVGINADGTVVVEFGSGLKSGACPVLAGYTPVYGDSVQVLKRDTSSWLVLGSVRSSNATTQNLVIGCRTPRNIMPSVSGVPNPLTINAVGTGAWRDADGWSRSEPYQGAFSTGRGYYRGCYFYGASPAAAIAGRTVTSVSIRLHRSTAIGAAGVGSSAAVGQYIAPHSHPTQPGDPPSFVDSAGVVLVGSLTAPDDLQVGTFALPTSWGQSLVDGGIAGFGHLRLTTTDYQRCKSIAEDAASGQLVIGWA